MTMTGTLPHSSDRAHRPVLFRHARIPVLHDFKGRSCFSSITVSEVSGNLDIAVGVDMTSKLDTKQAIDALPADIAFIGQDRNEKLSIWH
jgi:hypothetical protein